MSQEIVMDAVRLISRTQKISTSYLLSTFSAKELVSFAHQYNRIREANMDAIRENWLAERRCHYA